MDKTKRGPIPEQRKIETQKSESRPPQKPYVQGTIEPTQKK